MDPVLVITVVSVLLGAVIAFAFFSSYFGKRRSEVQSIAKAELQSDPKKHQRPPPPKKSHFKAHSHSTSDKVNTILNSSSSYRRKERKKGKSKGGMILGKENVGSCAWLTMVVQVNNLYKDLQKKIYCMPVKLYLLFGSLENQQKKKTEMNGNSKFDLVWLFTLRLSLLSSY